MASSKSKRDDFRKPGTVSVLTYGPDSNFAVFASDLYTCALQYYGDSANFLKKSKHYEMPVKLAQVWKDVGYTPTEATSLALKYGEEKMKSDNKVKSDNKRIFALIWDHLSEESRDSVTVDADFKSAEEDDDGLKLWLIVKKTHQNGVDVSGAYADMVIKKKYETCLMGAKESFPRYKERFDLALKNYQATRADNDKLKDNAVAWDFFHGLHPVRYREFMNRVKYDYRTAEVNKSLKYVDLAEMTRLFVPVERVDVELHQNDASYTTETAEKSDAKSAHATDVAKNQVRLHTDWSKIECDRCGQLGHGFRKCPKRNTSKSKFNSKSDQSKPSSGAQLTSTKHTVMMTQEEYDELQRRASVKSKKVSKSFTPAVHKMEAEENTSDSDLSSLLADNQANISILHPMYLKNVRSLKHPVTVNGAGGPTLVLRYKGELPGFFTVYASTDTKKNIICFADMEDKFKVTYNQGKHFIVHLPSGDLVFERKNTFYVADISHWADDSTELAAMTSSANAKKRRYTRKEVEMARLAYRFVEKTGATSLPEVIRLATQGHVTGVKFTKEDIIHAYDIWGQPVSYVRGSTTTQKVGRVRDRVDNLLEQTFQNLDIDVFTAAGHKFLLSVAHPMRLTMISRIDDGRADNVAALFQSHLDKLRSKGFDVKKVYSDRDSVLRVLSGLYPGVDFHAGGAGDHVVVADERIKAVKILARSAASRVPWSLPRSRIFVNGLMKFAVSRLTCIRASPMMSLRC